MAKDSFRQSLLRFGVSVRAEMPRPRRLSPRNQEPVGFTSDWTMEEYAVIVTHMIVIETLVRLDRGVELVSDEPAPKDFPIVLAFAFVIAAYIKSLLEDESVNATIILAKTARRLMPHQSEAAISNAIASSHSLARTILNAAGEPGADRWNKTVLTVLTAYVLDNGKTERIPGGYPKAFAGLLKDLLENVQPA